MDDAPNKPGTLTPKPTHQPNGKFAPGNKCGVGYGGNPWAAEVARFRSAVFRAVKVGDLRQVTQSVVEKAKGGDMRAAKLLYDITGIGIKRHEIVVEHQPQQQVRLHIFEEEETKGDGADEVG